jgi:hypothetical protein
MWDGTDWQQRTSLHTPSGLARHGMAFDMARQTTVVFGGRRNSWQPHVTANETWEWDHALGVWNPVFPVISPPGLMDPAMAYHFGSSKVVLFGGEDGNGDGSGETWTYDGTTWQLVPPVGPQPPARVGARLLEILNRGTCMLVGGYDPVTMVIPNDTWEFDGTTWTKIDNVYGGVYPARTGFAVVHDFGRDRTVLFGGKAANTALLGDTWEFGGHFSKFGMGCAGSGGVPALTPTALPKFGSTASATLSSLEPNAAFAVLIAGFSRTQWLGGSLPSLLTGIGMPGCRLYVSPDILIGLGASGGQATWNYTVPYQPADLGDTFYLQGLSLDAGVNEASMTVSNATTMVIGY